MMGPRQEAQSALFYDFSLEDHVPRDHLLRSIDRFVDLSSIRSHLAPFYSHTGRPSIDPELLIRMLIVGYCFGIRSERRLCEEVHLNLAYKWFCRLDLTDPVQRAHQLLLEVPGEVPRVVKVEVTVGQEQNEALAVFAVVPILRYVPVAVGIGFSLLGHTRLDLTVGHQASQS